MPFDPSVLFFNLVIGMMIVCGCFSSPKCQIRGKQTYFPVAGPVLVKKTQDLTVRISRSVVVLSSRKVRVNPCSVTLLCRWFMPPAFVGGVLAPPVN